MTSAVLSLKKNELSLQKSWEKIVAYLGLTKPGITGTVTFTALAGFLLANKGIPVSLQLLFHTLFSTALVAAGAGTLNMLSEADADSLMERTLHRPLPAGKISSPAAFLWGTLLSSLGIVHLAAQVNLLSCFLAACSLMLYLVLYTPLKKVTPFCTVFGAISGALPPLIGWSASSGRISAEALPLFFLLFFWQFPHLHALSWIYREDYQRANFKMVPKKKYSFNISFIFALFLIPIGLLPAFQGLTSHFYIFPAAALGISFAATAFYFLMRQNDFSARLLFKSSVLYLPLLLFLMVASSA